MPACHSSSGVPGEAFSLAALRSKAIKTTRDTIRENAKSKIWSTVKITTSPFGRTANVTVTKTNAAEIRADNLFFQAEDGIRDMDASTARLVKCSDTRHQLKAV